MGKIPGRLRCTFLLMLVTGLIAAEGFAFDFRTKLGPNRLEGLVDLELAYGVRWRVQDRDSALIGLGNGGDRADNANMDDGNLNYDEGEPVSNMVRTTGELTLKWGNLGAFMRGYAFYDYENEENNRARTDLTEEAKDQVGSDIELLDAYLSARFEVRDMPLQFRLGDQIVDRGESRFFPNDGVNFANPLNVALFQQPTSTPRDLRRPVGMLWGSVQPNPFFAIEGYYQYDWKKTVLPATGTYLSTSDPLFPGGRFFQAGPFSDQGTNLDAVFGLPSGTLGFDRDWFQVPRTGGDRPSDQGQLGFNLQVLIPKLNDTKFGLHFANYHSKVPSLSGFGPSLKGIEAYSVQGIAARAAELIQQGVAPEAAGAASAVLGFNEWLNDARYFTYYPDDIQMFGFSFNTTSLRTGTAFFGEVAHHIDAPIPVHPSQLLNKVLPDSKRGGFFDLFPPIDLDKVDPQTLANKRIDFIKELDKTFLAVGATQLFGPRFGASQTALTAEVGWLHVWDFPTRRQLLIPGPGLAVTQLSPKSAFADEDSWGYRLAGNLTYNNVFGAVNLRPRVIFTHDVNGVSPVGQGPFREDVKSLTVGLGGEYVQSLRADLSYTTFWGVEEWNLVNDRDFINFSIRYDF